MLCRGLSKFIQGGMMTLSHNAASKRFCSNKPPNDGTSKGDEVISSKPRGFEAFFESSANAPKQLKEKEPSPSKTDQKLSIPELTEEEFKSIQRLSLICLHQQRLRRSILVGIFLSIVLFLDYYLNAFYYFRFLRPIMVQEMPFLTSSRLPPEASYVVANVDNHSGLFYDSNGRTIGDATFIDYFFFENEIGRLSQEKRTRETSLKKPEESDELDDALCDKTLSKDGINFLTAVPSYYPWRELMFLWLLPLLVLIHRGVQTGIHSAREASTKAIANPEHQQKFRFRFAENVKTRFGDVAGMTEAKNEVCELLEFLQRPESFTALGARLPRGILLEGPPGTGKTLLAKALAGEAKVPFMSCSGSEFEEVFVGVGAQRVRQLFKLGREKKPCVIFIDEIDTFGRKRRSDAGKNSRGTINALLSELDGFNDASGILVLAATNRADILDEALKRAGRFDRKVAVELPPLKDRMAIACVHLAPLVLAPGLTLSSVAENLATLMPGSSGADIRNVCNEAAITAARQELSAVNLDCFRDALDKIQMGLERRAMTLSKTERHRIALHEAGHAVLAWFLQHTDPILKLTIVPRGSHVEGTSKKLPHEQFIITEQSLKESLVQKLGGYIVEEYFFENVSTSAGQDLREVTQLARNMVTVYGLSPMTLGHLSFDEQMRVGKVKTNDIDKAVQSVTEAALATARKLFKAHIQHVRIISGLLLKQETLNARDLWLHLGDRPNMSKELLDYLQRSTA